jgi:hypothetical protein
MDDQNATLTQHANAILERQEFADSESPIMISSWQSGDVLMLDNMLASHARAPFKGSHRVALAMTEGHGNLS